MRKTGQQALRCQTALPGHRFSWHLQGRRGTGRGLGRGAGNNWGKGISWRACPQPLTPLPCLTLQTKGPGSHRPLGVRRGLMSEAEPRSPPHPTPPLQRASMAQAEVFAFPVLTLTPFRRLSPPPASVASRPGSQGERSPPTLPSSRPHPLLETGQMGPLRGGGGGRKTGHEVRSGKKRRGTG